MTVAAALTSVAAAGLMLSAPAQAISGGAPAPAGSYTFAGRLDVGTPGFDGQSCSATLIDPAWIVTASSCFAASGLQAGPPPKPTTVTLGRTPSNAGRVVRVSYVAPRSDRNVTLALLATPVTDIAPAKLSTTPPTAGETLNAVGYGRTTDTWVPDQARVAPFTVNAATGTTATLTGANGVDTCKGDAGGPALRQTADNKVELVAVHSTSWQHGCMTVTETRQGSTQSRIDNITDWIGQQTAASPIRNANGLCMDLGSNEPGTTVGLAPCKAGNTSQQWRALPDGTIRNFNGLTLDIGSNAEGTPVAIATAQPGYTSQQWTRPDGTIRNFNGLCADLGANSPGTTVIMAACRAGAASQQWSTGELREVSGKIRNHNGLCADLFSNEPGTIVGMTVCQPGEWGSQRWTAPIDGTLRNANGLCMDLGSNEPGTQVGMAPCQIGNPSQQWRVTPEGAIRNYNGLVMDLASNAEGTPVIIATAQPGNTSQQWTLGS
ncbi:ricin-type beta-trefoil lectin domain protein [Amycolatopsis sp. NPDC058986]|uniref:ricin-type beta-trefoil lectin domain protein n=1 Tax=unclassified Amycolatopsis TaxID=2618356 RepID=UPI00366CEC35